MKLNKSDLKNKKMLIAGLTGCGKTELAKFISRNFRTVVYTPHAHEWESENVFLYKGDFINDFPIFMQKCISWGKKKEIDFVIVDEADMLFNSKSNISDSIKDLLINHRHYNLGLIMITRRPQNLPTQIYEEFHKLFLFSFESPNVIKKLNSIYEDLGETVKTLPFDSHKFVLKSVGCNPTISKIQLKRKTQSKK